MPEAQAVNEVNNTIQQAIAGGFQSIAAIQALTMLFAVIAFMFIARRFSRSQDSNGQVMQNAVQVISQQGQAYATHLEQVNERYEEQSKQVIQALQNNTEANNRAQDYRENQILATNNLVHSNQQVVERIGELKLDTGGRLGLLESTASVLNTNVGQLTSEVRQLAADIRSHTNKIDMLTQAIANAPNNDKEITTLLLGVAAEVQQISDLVSTIPQSAVATPPALQTTTTPETNS